MERGRKKGEEFLVVSPFSPLFQSCSARLLHPGFSVARQVTVRECLANREGKGGRDDERAEGRLGAAINAVAMIQAGKSSKLVAISNHPLLAGPARFSCGVVFTTTKRKG
jgi:hypothetical protein